MPDEVKGAAIGSSKNVVAGNDVLLSRIVPHIRRGWIVDAKNGHRQIASGEWIIFRSERFDPSYLRYHLLSDEFNRKFMRTIKGVGGSLMRADPNQVAKFKIPLPPLPTQRRIAAILDKAQALVANDKRTLAVYDQLAKSLFLEMFGDPVRNERGWEVVEFADVVEAIENGWSPNCESYPRSSADEWAVLKLGSVTYRQFNANENKVLPDIEAARPDLEVQVGDLLVTRKNTKELVGAAAYVFETAPRLMIPDLIFRILTRANKVEKLFLWMLLNEDGFQKNVQQLASGSASSMPNISKAKLMALPIPLPPLKAQQKFAKAALLLRDRRTGIETSLRRSEDLFGSLLQRAFSGELV